MTEIVCKRNICPFHDTENLDMCTRKEITITPNNECQDGNPELWEMQISKPHQISMTKEEENKLEKTLRERFGNI